MEQSGTAKDQDENEDQDQVEESATGKDANKEDDKSTEDDKDNNDDEGVHTYAWRKEHHKTCEAHNSILQW